MIPSGNVVDNNIFAYSLNSPVIFFDPQGFKAVDITYRLMSLMRINALKFAAYIFTQIVLRGVYKGILNSFKYFYNNSKTKGAWDLKNQGWKLSSEDWYVFKGKKLRQDDPGNIHFGYVGAVMFPLGILRAGAGVYQIYSGTSKWSYRFTFFDDPRDSTMIVLGYSLFIYDILKSVSKILRRAKLRFY